MENLRDFFSPLTLRIAKLFTVFHPNFISFLSIIFHLPGVYFYAKGDALMGTLFLIGAYLDKVDGDVAKLKNQATKFGAVLDATIDRFTEGLVIMGIVMGGLVPVWMGFLAFNLAVCVSFIKSKAEGAVGNLHVGKNKFSVGIGQRGDRTVIIFIGSLLAGILDKNEILIWAFGYLLFAQIVTLLWRGKIIYNVLEKKVDD